MRKEPFVCALGKNICIFDTYLPSYDEKLFNAHKCLEISVWASAQTYLQVLIAFVPNLCSVVLALYCLPLSRVWFIVKFDIAFKLFKPILAHAIGHNALPTCSKSIFLLRQQFYNEIHSSGYRLFPPSFSSELKLIDCDQQVISQNKLYVSSFFLL